MDKNKGDAMTYGKVYVKACVQKNSAVGSGSVRSDSYETHGALASNLAKDVDKALETAYDVRGGDYRGA